MSGVQGHYEEAFRGLAAAFEASFQEIGLDREHGAALCIFIDGRKAVDLWGGWTDGRGQRAWTENTRVPIFSATKGMATMVVQRLIDVGALTLETRLAELWSAFGVGGKDEVTIGHVLDHRAGLPWLPTGTRGLDMRQERWEAALADAPLVYPPGTRHIYHAATQGFLLDAVALRITGQRIADLFARWFAEPLDLACSIGLVDPTGVAEIIRPAAPGPAPRAEAVEQLCQLIDPPDFNRPEFLLARSPAASGLASAHDLAKLYAAVIDGTAGLTTAAVDRMTAVRWDAVEEISGLHWRMGGGMLLSGGFAPIGSSATAFGYPGRGGAVAFADPQTRMALAYLPNHPDPRPGSARLARLLATLPDQHCLDEASS